MTLPTGFIPAIFFGKIITTMGSPPAAGLGQRLGYWDNQYLLFGCRGKNWVGGPPEHPDLGEQRPRNGPHSRQLRFYFEVSSPGLHHPVGELESEPVGKPYTNNLTPQRVTLKITILTAYAWGPQRLACGQE